jgi:hypothetical protein
MVRVFEHIVYIRGCYLVTMPAGVKLVYKRCNGQKIASMTLGCRFSDRVSVRDNVRVTASFSVSVSISGSGSGSVNMTLHDDILKAWVKESSPLQIAFGQVFTRALRRGKKADIRALHGAHCFVVDFRLGSRNGVGHTGVPPSYLVKDG